MADKQYLANVPEGAIDQLLPKRRAMIEAASAELPRYDWNANRLARALHPQVQHAVVTSVTELNGARRFALAADPSAGTETLAYFRAGQYVSVSMTIGESVLTRPYSLCSAPADARTKGYEILVKRKPGGFGSEHILSTWQVGTKVDLSAPCGLFTYEPLRDARHIVGIAGGSGISPFVSLARAIADGTEDAELTLLYGSRTEADILFHDELDALAAQCDRIKVVYVLSDEQRPGYLNGLITAELIRKHAPEGDYSVFVCGTQGMLDFIAAEFATLGLPRRRLRLDISGEPPLPGRDSLGADPAKAYTLTVQLRDETRTIPARADETLLVALERAGIPAPSRCRSGECGFCRSRLVSGTVHAPEAMEHRRSYDAVCGFVHPCCTYPTSDCTIALSCEKPERVLHVKDMARKGRMMSLTMTLIISASMGAMAAFLVLKNNPAMAENAPKLVVYLMNILLSSLCGILSARFLPFSRWDRSLTRRFNAAPPSMKHTLLNSLPISVGNTLLIGLVCSFFGVMMARAKMPPEALKNVPMLGMWLGSWARLVPPTLVVSYLIAVVLSPTISEAIGLSTAGAEVGRACAEDTSLNARRDAEKNIKEITK